MMLSFFLKRGSKGLSQHRVALKCHHYATSLFPTRSVTNAGGGGWKGNHLLCDI